MFSSAAKSANSQNLIKCFGRIRERIEAMEYYLTKFEIWSRRDNSAYNEYKVKFNHLEGLPRKKAQLGEVIKRAGDLEREVSAHVTVMEHKLEGAGLPWNENNAKQQMPLTHPREVKVTINGTEYIAHVDDRPRFEGGYGAMYVATHPQLEFKLVLKCPIIKGQSSKEDVDNTMRRFSREGDRWMHLDHEHILKCLGTNTVGDSIPWMISPYMEGGNLLQFVKANRGCSKETLLRDMASALAYLHRSDIIHGDVKAQNAVVHTNGHLYLCDFGLSKASNEDTSEGSKNSGSYFWWSPERWASPKKTREDDVFGFGITIAEVVKEASPWDDLQDLRRFAEVIQGGGRPEMPECPLRTVAELCWVQEPEKRESMADVMRSIERLL